MNETQENSDTQENSIFHIIGQIKVSSVVIRKCTSVVGGLLKITTRSFSRFPSRNFFSKFNLKGSVREK